MAHLRKKEMQPRLIYIPLTLNATFSGELSHLEAKINKQMSEAKVFASESLKRFSEAKYLDFILKSLFRHKKVFI